MITFSENKAGGEYYYYGSGGAIAVVKGTFIIEVSALFTIIKQNVRVGQYYLQM